MIPQSLDDKFKHGEFIGLTVRDAAQKRPRAILKMYNRGEVKLSPAEVKYIKDQIL